MAQNRRVLTLVLMMILVVLAGVLGGCGPKKVAITSEKFNEVLVEKGYAVLDMSKNLNPEQVKSLTVAMKKTYKVEFYVMPNRAAAVDVFNSYVDGIPQGEDSPEKNAKVLVKKKTSDYSVYRRLTDQEYSYLVRIGDTLLSVAATAADQEEIDGLFEALGYHMK